MRTTDSSQSSANTTQGGAPSTRRQTDDPGQEWRNYFSIMALDLVVIVMGFMAFGIPSVARLATLDVALAAIGCLLLVIAHVIWAKRLANAPSYTAHQQAGIPSIAHDTWIGARILLMVSIVVAFGMELSGSARLIWGGALLIYGLIAVADTVIGGTALRRDR